MGVTAVADEAVVRRAEILPEENAGYIVNADVDFELNNRLEEALNHGVALNFVAEFILENRAGIGLITP